MFHSSEFPTLCTPVDPAARSKQRPSPRPATRPANTRTVSLQQLLSQPAGPEPSGCRVASSELADPFDAFRWVPYKTVSVEFTEARYGDGPVVYAELYTCHGPSCRANGRWLQFASCAAVLAHLEAGEGLRFERCQVPGCGEVMLSSRRRDHLQHAHPELDCRNGQHRPVCRDWARGRCSRGAGCKYVHASSPGGGKGQRHLPSPTSSAGASPTPSLPPSASSSPSARRRRGRARASRHKPVNAIG